MLVNRRAENRSVDRSPGNLRLRFAHVLANKGVRAPVVIIAVYAVNCTYVGVTNRVGNVPVPMRWFRELRAIQARCEIAA